LEEKAQNASSNFNCLAAVSKWKTALQAGISRGKVWERTARVSNRCPPKAKVTHSNRVLQRLSPGDPKHLRDDRSI